MATATYLTGPEGHPLIGNALGLSREALGFLQRCAREYGDLVPLRYFWRPILFVNNPDYIEQVLTTNQRQVVKDIFQRTDHTLIGNGLFLSEGEFWLRQRRMMQPAFHHERIVGYGRTMAAYSERLGDSWAGEGEVRDVYRDMSGLTMSIVANALFDADVWGDAAEVAEALDEALDCLSARVRSVESLLPEWIPTITLLRLRRARRRLDRFVYGFINQRRSSGKDVGDLLSLLLQARGEDGVGMTDEQVRDEVMTLFVGGYETAADLLTWAWYLLAQHPEQEAALHAELDTVLGDRPPTVDDLPRLTYTANVISEALRLYPPAPALGREATADFELGGHRIKKGTDIFVSQWVIQRDARYFDEPDAFQPERWADGLAQRLPRYAYFPFGGGPRQCIGNTFAIMEASLVLASLARRFRLAVAPGEQVEMEQIPTLRPKGGLRMTIHSR